MIMPLLMFGGAYLCYAEAVKWTVATLLPGIVGLFVGAVSIPVIGFAFAPAWRLFKAFYASTKSRDRGLPKTMANSPVSPDHGE
jgi:hypothetical protein